MIVRSQADVNFSVDKLSRPTNLTTFSFSFANLLKPSRVVGNFYNNCHENGSKIVLPSTNFWNFHPCPNETYLFGAHIEFDRVFIFFA